MKKLNIIGFFLLGSLILTACENSSNTSSPNKSVEKTTQTKQTTSEHSVDETSSLENLDIAMEKLKTGDITEISGSDFIVGEDIEPGRYIIKPTDGETVQFKIHNKNGNFELYNLGITIPMLKSFKLEKGDRIELTVKKNRIEAELLEDNLSNLSKGETAYISGGETIVGEDLPAGQYTFKPMEDKGTQFKIYHSNGESQVYNLGITINELKAFKLVDGERIDLTTKRNILEVTRTK